MIWFSERYGRRIVRFNPTTAVFTEIDMPLKDIKLIDIVVDREGNVWFTEAANNKIGKIDVSKLSILKKDKDLSIQFTPPKDLLKQ